MKARKLLLVIATIALLGTAVCAKDYKDVPDTHWAREQIAYLSDEIAGYPDGTFRPESTVTRAEFVTLLARTVFPEELKNETGDTWWKAAYRVCEANNLLSGSAGYNDAMPRGEIAQMLGYLCSDWGGVNARADAAEQFTINWNEQRMELPEPKPKELDAERLRACANQGLMMGYPDGTFKPKNGVTRAETAAILSRLKAQLALRKEGYDYVILPEDATPTGSSSIETREDGLKCAKLFRENRDRIDGIIVSLPNFGFEIGIINAISVADLNVPVLVQACDDENDKVDLDSRRDAFCGKISVCNNLYQYGIPFTDTTLHTYSIYSDLLAADINKFAAICRVVNGLRHARVGAIGTRPAGFQTVRASEKLLQASGITVVPVDLSEILSAARKIEDADETLQAKLKEIRQYAAVPEQYNDKLILQAKFGVAVEQWMEANEIDAVAIQCWDSLEQNYGCAACVTMSMLSEKLIPAACEVDIAGAVSMYALTLASGRPSALLDWNNNFAEDRNKCVCTHCGNFPKSFVMNDLKLGTLGVLGRTLGKVHTFGAVYGKVKQGDFTFFRISTDDTKGCIKSYLGKGDLTDDPYGMDGCIAVTKVDNLQPLMKYICKNGFEHHVAMCRGNVKDILAEAIETYLNWNIYIHE